MIAYERGQFGKNGQRRYISCSAVELFFYYFQIPQRRRNHYEVICEHKPCKLYFDLEFKRCLNPDKNGSEMVATFIDLICEASKFKHSQEQSRQDIMYLDSTTREKFSCHLVFTKTVFENNDHAGSFVKSFCAELKAAISSVEDVPLENCELRMFNKSWPVGKLKDLFVRTDCDNDRKDIFVDLAVYSKNRNFRMFKSTKLGKSTFLNRAPNCSYVPELKQCDYNFDKQLKSGYRECLHINPELYRTFLDSLITNIDFEPKAVFSEEKLVDDNLLSINGDNVIKYHSKSVPTIIENKSSGAFLYHDLEMHILKTLRKRMQHLEITICDELFFRTCKTIPNSSLVMYELGHTYRYCENIGRFHKSNKVYICVDIDKSIFYQKCFDPDCEGFRGNEFKFPEELIPWKGFEDELLDDWQ